MRRAGGSERHPKPRATRRAVAVPEEVGLEVAHIAGDAATARLEKILLHRPVLTRDDRRLLVKAAREALRAEGRRRVSAGS